MVELSRQKRLKYEKVSPVFWRYRGSEAEKIQSDYFKELMCCEEHILLTAKQNKEIMGFIIGKILPAPEVYDPGGSTLMVDDFCVKEELLWNSVGKSLLKQVKKAASKRDVIQILIVRGAHDIHKKSFLKQNELAIVSEWHIGSCAE